MSLIADIRVPTPTYPLGKFLSRYRAVRVEVERMVPIGGSTHHVWLEGADRARLMEELHDEDAIQHLAIIDEHPDRTLLRFEWASKTSPLFELLEKTDSTIASFRSTDDGWLIQLRFSGDEDLLAFCEAVNGQGIELEFVRTYDERHPIEGSAYGLTNTQAETLSVAYEAGYFEVPRGITLAELADDLGVSEQAVSERLRRGLSALLDSTGVDDADDGESADN